MFPIRIKLDSKYIFSTNLKDETQALTVGLQLRIRLLPECISLMFHVCQINEMH